MERRKRRLAEDQLQRSFKGGEPSRSVKKEAGIRTTRISRSVKKNLKPVDSSQVPEHIRVQVEKLK